MSIQIQAQMYIVVIDGADASHPSNCPTSYDAAIMTIVDPLGNIEYVCLPDGGQPYYNGENIATINLEFNSIINQGYKLVGLPSGDNTLAVGGGDIDGVWYFAVP
tara:strand:- start:621 stop:935 length:315 start_codon:yes stop_codon:yes gene_type:complete